MLGEEALRIGIMQPYFLPYIGYWQLINAVDAFVIYDNIKYTKKGWINRNRILVEGKDYLFTLPIKKDSDYLNVDQRQLSDTFAQDSLKLIRKIESAYEKAPYFQQVMRVVKSCLHYGDRNLFSFIGNSVAQVCEYLGIHTPIVKSSLVRIDDGLKKEYKVEAICNALGATDYVNPIGGIELYDKEDFHLKGLNLMFLKTGDVKYKQFTEQFVPSLSIIDVMMFNSIEAIHDMLNQYELI